MGSNEMDVYWRDRKRQIKALAEAGNVIFMVQGRRLQVIVPKHPDFIKGAGELAGRYRPRTGIWSFDRRMERLVRELVERVWPGKGTGTIVSNLNASNRL